MIVWINGAFGSGKTSVSNELNQRLENSYVYDPEEVGFFIRDNIPPELKKSDFQDFNLWREINYEMLTYISSNFSGIVIVPMTVINEQYFNETVGRLKSDGLEVHHFTLLASKDTLLDRLKQRGDEENTWIYSRIDWCIQSLSSESFKEHIRTDEKSIKEIVEIIAASCNFELLPSEDKDK